MKTIQLSAIVLLVFSLIISSCNSSNEKEEKSEETKDTVTTDEAELPVIDEVEMDFMYEVTNTKTKKTMTMSQVEYLESGIWENPDVTIREVPIAR
jgi:hypothetical protein